MTLLQPDVRPIDEHYYELVELYTYIGKKYKVEVPKGFITDIASIPQFAWSLVGLSPDGLYRAAAIVHDWCYWNYGYMKGTVTKKGSAVEYVSKREADKLFFEVMKEAGVSAWKRNLMYAAVSLFGHY